MTQYGTNGNQAPTYHRAVACDCSAAARALCGRCFATGVVDGACDTYAGDLIADTIELERCLVTAPEIVATDVEANATAFARTYFDGEFRPEFGSTVHGAYAQLRECKGEIGGCFSTLEVIGCDLVIDGSVSQSFHASNSRIECETQGGIHARRGKERGVYVSFTDCDLHGVILDGLVITPSTFARCRCVDVELVDCAISGGVVLPEGVTVRNTRAVGAA